MQGYFDVLTMIPAGILLERSREKSWSFKTKYTHVFRHLEPRTKKILKEKIYIYIYIILSDS